MSERCPGPGKAKEPWLLAGAPVRERATFCTPKGSLPAEWPLGATFRIFVASSRGLAHSAACERGSELGRAVRHRAASTRAPQGSARAGEGRAVDRHTPAQLAQAKKSKSNSATPKVRGKKTKIISARTSASKMSRSTCGGGG